MTKNRGNGKKTQPRRRNRGGGGLQSGQEIKTIGFESAYSTSIKSVKAVTGIPILPDTTWPGLKSVTQGHVQWRVRTLQAEFRTFNTSTPKTIACLLTHVGNEWQPSGWSNMEQRGGNIKPAKGSGWKTNVLSAQYDWALTTTGQGAVLYYIDPQGEDGSEYLGTWKIKGTIQVRAPK